jgi:hypothetical protein
MQKMMSKILSVCYEVAKQPVIDKDKKRDAML